MNKKPLILIVNDDGHEANGVWALAKAAAIHGELCIVLPDGPRSAMGHAITTNVPLRLKKGESHGFHYYRTNGTPVDCVKMARKILLKDRKIDLVLSGINHGSNSSSSILYSGTMAAAIEGSFYNIPSIGFSLLDYSPDADFRAAEVVAEKIISRVLHNPFPPHICLNVNIPKLSINEIKGIRVTHQAWGIWEEEFEKRKDTFDRTYYWMSGTLVQKDLAEGSCQWALREQYVSIQPVEFDMTAYQYIDSLKFLEK